MRDHSETASGIVCAWQCGEITARMMQWRLGEFCTQSQIDAITAGIRRTMSGAERAQVVTASLTGKAVA